MKTMIRPFAASILGALALSFAPAGMSYPVTDLGGLAAADVSGNLVAGVAEFGWETHAAAWNAATGAGPLDLGVLGGDPGWSYSYAVAVDGSIVIGDSSTSYEEGNRYSGGDHVFAIDLSAPSPVMKDLGTLGGYHSHATAVAGKTVVGYSMRLDWSTAAFAYDLTTSTMTDLGELGGGDACPCDIEGRIVVGWSRDFDWNVHAFICDLSAPAPQIVPLPDNGSTWSTARAVSGNLVFGEIGNNVVAWDISDLAHPRIIDLGPGVAFDDIFMENEFGRVMDGKIAVGLALRSDGVYTAAAWDLSNLGQPVRYDLAILPGGTRAVPKSISGKLIVGEAFDADGVARAVAWQLGTAGLIDLGTLGGPSSIAWAVDGGRIVGQADATDGSHAAVWTIPFIMEQEAKDSLSELQVVLVDKKDKTAVTTAMDHLSKAMASDRWLDLAHLVPGEKGLTFFDQTKAAALKLWQLGKRGGTAGALIQESLAQILATDRTLVEIAIAEAAARGGNATLIARAKAELANGDTDAALNRPQEAIDHYKNAWALAVGA